MQVRGKFFGGHVSTVWCIAHQERSKLGSICQIRHSQRFLHDVYRAMGVNVRAAGPTRPTDMVECVCHPRGNGALRRPKHSYPPYIGTDLS